MKSLSTNTGLLSATILRKSLFGLFLGLSTLAFAGSQPGETEGFNADIPFDFTAGTKTLSAGTYSFRYDSSSQTVSVSSRGREFGRVSSITRLGTHEAVDAATLIFDRIAGTRTLSEVWIPGTDGILVHITPKEHTHDVVRVVVTVALR